MPIPDNLLPNNSHLSIRLLGHMAIDVDGQAMAKVPSQKIGALLAYLVCNPGPHTRTKLADLLWDDIPYDRYLPNLRSTLNRLPKVFKPYIITSRETITFDPHNVQGDDQEEVGIWVDVLAFQQLAEQLPKPSAKHSEEYIAHLSDIADLMVAMVGQYKGPFLEGLILSDAPGFSDWQFIQREHLQRLTLECLGHLVELSLHQGQYVQGIAYAREMIALDPLDENSRHRLMVMLARSGQQPAAMKEYDALVDMLEEEFGAPPSSEIVADYERMVMMDKPNLDGPSKLPIFSQPLIGRQTELASLLHQLKMPERRLITVTGLGGIGKTYLIVEVAKRVEKNRDFLQGVAYISLAGTQSPDRIPEAIVQALDLVVSSQDDLFNQICCYLEAKEILLVFDNFEHLLVDRTNPGAKMIARILQVAPQVKVLLSSRQPLQLQREYLFPLSGMTLPESSSVFSLDDLVQLDAIRLFQQTALHNTPEFEITEENSPGVIDFCTLVQGTPLAIVLGAAHMDFLTPEELVEECQESLDLLETEWADLPERQRSVRAVFEHSWSLLDTSLQSDFQKLTIFKGGFTRQAARKIVGASIQHLKRLHSHSLIQSTESARYQIHELLRQFGAEKLEVNLEFAQQRSIQNRYMNFYLDWLGQQTDKIQGPKPHESVKIIEADINNIRQAWDYAVDQLNVDLLSKSNEALSIFYEMQGLYQEALDAFTHATQALQPHIKMTDQPHLDEPGVSYLYIYCMLLASQGIFYDKLGDYKQTIQKAKTAIHHFDSISEINTENNYFQVLGYRVWAIGLCKQNDYATAYDKANQSLTYAKLVSNHNCIADGLYLRGFIHFYLDQFDAALKDAKQAYTLYIQAGNRWQEIRALNLLGIIKEWQGELSLAKNFYEQAIQISHEIGDALNEHNPHIFRIIICMGEYIDAECRAQKSLLFFRNIGDKITMARIHHCLAMIYNKLGLYSETKYHQAQATQLMTIREAHGDYLIEQGKTYNGQNRYEETLKVLTEAMEIANELKIDYLQAEVLKSTAHVHNLSGQTLKSIQTYEKALDFYQDSELEYEKIQVMAGLADVLQQSGDITTSTGYMKNVLSYLEKNPEKIYKFEEPFEFYLNCYYALDGCQDQRSLSILDTAYNLLQTYAERIKDGERRTIFLENVASNRALIRLWKKHNEHCK